MAASCEPYDRIDIVVNVVGSLWLDAKYTPVTEVQEQRWDMCFTVNPDVGQAVADEFAE